MDLTKFKIVIVNILITGVGGPTPRSFVRAIKSLRSDFSNNYKFIGVDADPFAYGLYDKRLFDKSFVVPKAMEKGYWQAINKIIAEENIDCAIILPEVEVLQWAKNHRSELIKPIKLHLPDYKLAAQLVNKYSLHTHLIETEFIPKFIKVNPKNYSFEKISETIGHEFWVRSTQGSSGLGSLKIENKEMLAQWISINPSVQAFIATEFLPGRNMACKLLYFDGKLTRTACAERINYIMAKVAPSGITGNTSFGRLINEPSLIELSSNVLKRLSQRLKTGLNGIFTVDFKEDKQGNPKITEINIRHVAFTSSIAAGGANLPADTLAGMFMQDPREMETVHYSFDEELIFLRDVDGAPILMKETDLLK